MTSRKSGSKRPGARPRATPKAKASAPGSLARKRRKLPFGRSLRRRILVGLLVSSSCVCVGALLLWLWGRDAPSPVQGDGLTLHRLVLSNDDPVEVAGELERRGLISDVHAFIWYHRMFLGRARIETGTHLVPAGMAPRDLVMLLARRRTRPSRAVVIPEGFDVFQVAERLQRQGICPADDFTGTALDDTEAAIDVQARSYEGYLYPATYELRLNTAPRVVVLKLVEQAKQRFEAVFTEHASRLGVLRRDFGFDRHEVVTLASVVQAETAALDEVGTIASVFFNRLRDPDFKPRAALQSDPTAGYGCKLPDAPPSCAGFSGRITPSLLRDPANRYNTYRHAGLPPGPISNPSAEVVQGVLTAPRTEYLYFVAGKNGRHVFSRTFREHRAAIASGKDR